MSLGFLLDNSPLSFTHVDRDHDPKPGKDRTVNSCSYLELLRTQVGWSDSINDYRGPTCGAFLPVIPPHAQV